MKKLIYGLIGIIFIFTLMYAEYRFIMCKQIPYIINDNTVHVEIFGRVDEYYTEN